jgi:hypothetical protein
MIAVFLSLTLSQAAPSAFAPFAFRGPSFLVRAAPVLAPDDAEDSAESTPAAVSTSSLAQKPLAITLACIAVLSLGFGAGLGINASDLARQANDSTSEFFFRRLGDEARGSATAANVSYGLSVAAAAGAVLAFFLEGS